MVTGHQPVENFILAIRHLFGISSLCDLETDATAGTFRVANAKITPSVMGAWIHIADMVSDENIPTQFDPDRLEELIDALKKELNREKNVPERLTAVFKDFGIVFRVIPHFTGAPVQGYIAKGRGNTYRIVLTIRGGGADRFWFTLFHELSHIVNRDLTQTNTYIDSAATSMQTKSTKERAADEFARKTLIDDESYNEFVSTHKNIGFSDQTIGAFAESVGDPLWIVKGRLQNDGYVQQSNRSQMLKYYWANAKKPN